MTALPIIGPSIVIPLFTAMGHTISTINAAEILVGGTTIWSGLSYVFNKGAFKYVGQSKEKEITEEKKQEKL
jgi:hypothetical protein